MGIAEQFAVLGLPPAANEEQVRRAYRKLVMKWHPDRFATRDARTREAAHEHTRQLAQAYAAIREHLRAKDARKSAAQTLQVPRPIPVPRSASCSSPDDPVVRPLWMWFVSEKTKTMLLVGLVAGILLSLPIATATIGMSHTSYYPEQNVAHEAQLILLYGAALLPVLLVTRALWVRVVAEKVKALLLFGLVAGALLFLLVATVTIGMSDIPHYPEQNQANELKLLALYGVVLVPVLLFVVIPAFVRWSMRQPPPRKRRYQL